MLYLFTGDDTKKKLSSHEKFMQAFPKGVGTFFIARNDFDRMQVESLYSGSSLFSPVSAVVFQNILEYPEARDFILNVLKQMAESGNSFVFLEGKLAKPFLDAFKKAGAQVEVFELSKVKKEKFDTFRIANAFGNKDKLNTWIYFREAIENGSAMEELAGILFWKVKDMILKRNFGKFSEAELKTCIAKLSYLLPEARQSGLDAEAAFEQFLLEAF